MIVKIDSAKSFGASGVGATPAKTSSAAAKTSSTSSTAAKSSSSDTLSLTGDALSLQSLSQALADAPSVSTKRISELRGAIANGTYKVNADSVASKLLQSQQGF